MFRTMFFAPTRFAPCCPFSLKAGTRKSAQSNIRVSCGTKITIVCNTVIKSGEGKLRVLRMKRSEVSRIFGCIQVIYIKFLKSSYRRNFCTFKVSFWTE